jgi:chromosome segregation ATPase
MASADLALAMEQAGDAGGSDEVAKQVQETAAALSARKLELQKEHERTGVELERTQAQLTKAESERDTARERERELAGLLVSAAKGDPELAEATADLALALEEVKPGQPLPAEVAPQLASTVSSLSARKRTLADEAERLKAEIESARAKMQDADERSRALESERDEMAESGKEIITQLRQQKDAREKELSDLREENDKAAAKLEEFERRMTTAEAGNRKLAESLAAVATAAAKHEIADAPSIEDPRMDLEVALSQLPSEGEEDVVAPHDIAEQIADSGKKLADALTARHQAAVEALEDAERGQQILQGEIEKLKSENAATRKTLEERDTALKRNLAEVTAIRKEMADQGNALAARVQEISNARSELAGSKADLETASARLNEQETRLTEARTQLAESRKDLDRLRTEHADSHSRAQTAEQNQAQLAQSLRSLGTLGGQGVSDPVSKAAQKLDLAKNVGGDDLAAASKAFVEVVRSHAQGQAHDLADARAQLTESKAGQGRLEGELANLRAAVVDRDHQLGEAKAEAAKAGEAHAQSLSQAMASNAELEKLRTQIEVLQENLRHTEAELEDYRAREGASAGHLGDEVGRLSDEAQKQHQARRTLEAQLAELREKVEASEARLKRQREELERRLAERDAIIQEKDRLLDDAGAKKTDATGLQAQIQDLGVQLAAATERIKELESLHGAASKSGDLAKDLKKAQAERDAMREKQRKLEGELAESVSAQEELRTQLDEKRKEVQGAREEIAAELGDERKKTAALREEFRKLKEEVVGLRARLKKLTEK